MSPNVRFNQPIYLQSGDPDAENVSALHAPGQLGTRFTVIQPSRATPTTEEGQSKSYQLVRTDSTMTVTPYDGAVAWWADRTQYLVTTSPTTLGRGRSAGIFKNAVTLGNYCCVQWGGPARVKFVDAPTAAPTVAGLIVIPSATAAKADCLAAGTAATYPALGVSASAINAGDQTALVELNVPETT